MLKLRIPDGQAERMKELGGKIDESGEYCYVGDRNSYIKFAPWITEDLILCNAYLAVNTRTCWKCHKTTQTIALVTTRFYEVDTSGERVNLNPMRIILTMPFLYPPAGLAKFLQEEFNFKMGYSKTTGEENLYNHCQSCGALQGDFFLFYEMGPGSFNPSSAEEASNINIYPIKLPYDVPLTFDVGGYEDNKAIAYGYKLNEDYFKKELVWE